MTGPGVSIHAVCVVLGEDGVLIRGPAGSGKSSLGRRLVEERRIRGGFACLVGDDRLLVRAVGNRLVARCHPALAGLTEVRGWGIVPVPHEPAAVVRLVLDLRRDPVRLPDEADLRTSILGIELPRRPAAIHDAAAVAEMTLSWQARHDRDWNQSN